MHMLGQMPGGEQAAAATATSIAALLPKTTATSPVAIKQATPVAGKGAARGATTTPMPVRAHGEHASVRMTIVADITRNSPALNILSPHDLKPYRW